MIKKILLLIGLAVLGVGGYFVWKIGPRNLIGMWRYDQRQEGRLKVGDPAPDVQAVDVQSGATVGLASYYGDRPTVLIFGSFT